ncbi:hypothetical protein IAS59_003780 [Cryptococcus gattii]
MRENLPKDIDISRLASTNLLQQHFGRLSTFRPSPALAPSFKQAILRISNLTPKRKHANGGDAAGHLEDIVITVKCREAKIPPY